MEVLQTATWVLFDEVVWGFGETWGKEAGGVEAFAGLAPGEKSTVASGFMFLVGSAFVELLNRHLYPTCVLLHFLKRDHILANDIRSYVCSAYFCNCTLASYLGTFRCLMKISRPVPLKHI